MSTENKNYRMKGNTKWFLRGVIFGLIILVCVLTYTTYLCKEAYNKCSAGYDKMVAENQKPLPAQTKIDSVLIKANKTLLAVTYLNYEINCHKIADEYERKYFTSRQEKFKKLFNKYNDSTGYWERKRLELYGK